MNGPTVDILPYDGELSDMAQVKDYRDRLADIVDKCAEKVEEKLGRHAKPPEDYHITLKLSDDLDSIPMVSPTGLTRTITNKKTGKTVEQEISISSELVLNNGMGITTPDKILTHELTHSMLGYNNQRYNEGEDWLTEGIAMWAADQGPDFENVPENMRNERYYKYKKWLDRFDNYINTHGIEKVLKKIGRDDKWASHAPLIFKNRNIKISDILLLISATYVTYRLIKFLATEC